MSKKDESEIGIKIRNMMDEIHAVEGFIDDNKRIELKSKYPGLRSIDSHIDSHNEIFAKIKPKRRPNKKNNKSAPFKNKLKNINPFIDDGTNKLNPNKKEIELNKTENEVYYLHEYTGNGNLEHVDEEHKKMTKQIRNYKNGLEYNIEMFTDELIGAIEYLLNYECDKKTEKALLVSLPSSTQKRDKNSSMKKTIDKIERKYKNGLIRFNKEIINANDLLIRVEDVKTAHRNKKNRPKYEDHIRTIKFNEDKFNNHDDAIFILLDDITTSGAIMDACGDILKDNDIKEEDIYKLVIGATV